MYFPRYYKPPMRVAAWIGQSSLLILLFLNQCCASSLSEVNYVKRKVANLLNWAHNGGERLINEKFAKDLGTYCEYYHYWIFLAKRRELASAFSDYSQLLINKAASRSGHILPSQETFLKEALNYHFRNGRSNHDSFIDAIIESYYELIPSTFNCHQVRQFAVQKPSSLEDIRSQFQQSLDEVYQAAMTFRPDQIETVKTFVAMLPVQLRQAEYFNEGLMVATSLDIPNPCNPKDVQISLAHMITLKAMDFTININTDYSLYRWISTHIQDSFLDFLVGSMLAAEVFWLRFVDVLGEDPYLELESVEQVEDLIIKMVHLQIDEDKKPLQAGMAMSLMHLSSELGKDNRYYRQMLENAKAFAQVHFKRRRRPKRSKKSKSTPNGNTIELAQSTVDAEVVTTSENQLIEQLEISVASNSLEVPWAHIGILTLTLGLLSLMIMEH